MRPVEDACECLRFSTDGLPEAARAKAVRDLYENTNLPGRFEPLEPLPNSAVRADITKWELPGLGVVSGTLCGLRQAARSRASVSDGEDDLLLGVNLCGSSVVQQGDRELALQDGDAVLATRGGDRLHDHASDPGALYRVSRSTRRHCTARRQARRHPDPDHSARHGGA